MLHNEYKERGIEDRKESETLEYHGRVTNASLFLVDVGLQVCMDEGSKPEISDTVSEFLIALRNGDEKVNSER